MDARYADQLRQDVGRQRQPQSRNRCQSHTRSKTRSNKRQGIQGNWPGHGERARLAGNVAAEQQEHWERQRMIIEQSFLPVLAIRPIRSLLVQAQHRRQHHAQGEQRNANNRLMHAIPQDALMRGHVTRDASQCSNDHPSTNHQHRDHLLSRVAFGGHKVPARHIGYQPTGAKHDVQRNRYLEAKRQVVEYRYAEIQPYHHHPSLQWHLSLPQSRQPRVGWPVYVFW
ncbi:hypothetical protein GGI06_003216 [Coemansia sp. S85]|nr:hypothetical protein GGI06_003216 [Coemansia sp. S85]